jgi:hypothetical protein
MPSQPRSPALPSLPAEAALSFLKDTKGTLTWSARDLADSLKISPREAAQVLSVLRAQGYAHPASTKDQWLTTPAGETVSRAKPPRFTRERVEQALADLQARIQQNNKDPNSSFRITAAIAFGDFLLPNRARVQAADVGIILARREAPANPTRSRRPAASSSIGQKVGNSANPAPSTNPSAEPRSYSEAQAERNFLRQLRAKSALLTLRPYADWMRLRSHRSVC